MSSSIASPSSIITPRPRCCPPPCLGDGEGISVSSSISSRSSNSANELRKAGWGGGDERVAREEEGGEGGGV